LTKPITTSVCNRAFFWIASGKQYVREAALSAASVMMHHPNVDRFLVTPDDIAIPAVFNFFIKTPPRESPHWYVDSTRYFDCALGAMDEYRHLIYLDTDTRVLLPLDDLFALLAKFDLAGAHAPGRVTRVVVNPVPLSFPEINIGVLALRNSKKLRRFVAHWKTLYEENADYYGNNDQASLREALWENKAKIAFYLFPPEYNFRFGFGGWARYPIHVLHGRTDNWTALIQKANAHNSFRGWGPGELP